MPSRFGPMSAATSTEVSGQATAGRRTAARAGLSIPRIAADAVACVIRPDNRSPIAARGSRRQGRPTRSALAGPRAALWPVGPGARWLGDTLQRRRLVAGGRRRISLAGPSCLATCCGRRWPISGHRLFDAERRRDRIPSPMLAKSARACWRQGRSRGAGIAFVSRSSSSSEIGRKRVVANVARSRPFTRTGPASPVGYGLEQIGRTAGHRLRQRSVIARIAGRRSAAALPASWTSETICDGRAVAVDRARGTSFAGRATKTATTWSSASTWPVAFASIGRFCSRRKTRSCS